MGDKRVRSGTFSLGRSLSRSLVSLFRRRIFMRFGVFRLSVMGRMVLIFFYFLMFLGFVMFWICGLSLGLGFGFFGGLLLGLFLGGFYSGFLGLDSGGRAASALTDATRSWVTLSQVCNSQRRSSKRWRKLS